MNIDWQSWLPLMCFHESKGLVFNFNAQPFRRETPHSWVRLKRVRNELMAAGTGLGRTSWNGEGFAWRLAGPWSFHLSLQSSFVSAAVGKHEQTWEGRESPKHSPDHFICECELGWFSKVVGRFPNTRTPAFATGRKQKDVILCPADLFRAAFS